MNRLIDIHSHIIPGVDDGAKTIDDSIAILKAEIEQGVTDIILTPHFRMGMFETPRAFVEKQFRLLCDESEKLFPDLKLYLGCEFHSNSELADMVAMESRYRMIGTEYVLLEFSSLHSKNYIRGQVYALTARGFCPVIAHCERYQAFLDDFNFSRDLTGMGAELQVNADSVIGKCGWGTKRFVRKLLKSGMAAYIGSDVHDVRERATHIGEARRYVEKTAGQVAAERIFEENPIRIINASNLRRLY
ncbi:MAG: capsular biosynthesis protein [Lachnospiraceae bacterium]|nr:capsular biosynthesis protein [Lachnospiraceae bacterium]